MGNCKSRRQAGAPTGTPSSERPPKKKLTGRKSGKIVLSNRGDITDFYRIDCGKLGEGSYGSVSVAIHKGTEDKRAIKKLSLANVRQSAKFRQEVEIMKSMDHPNIIKLYETFEDSRNMYLAMELCQGGELFDVIVQSGCIMEKDVASLMKQILSAVFYMHTSKVTHRDLKPENFLLSAKGAISQGVIKIIDFGLSTYFQPGLLMKTKAGTPYYVSPQVLQGNYTEACDLWSCGVIMYVMLVGYPPFEGRSDNEVLAKVRLGKYSFSKHGWNSISEDAKNLIRGLLKFDPQLRTSAEQALQDTWIKECAPSAESASLSDSLMQNLQKFQSQNKMKKAALNIIAGQLRESEISELKEVFKALDSNGDGLLTLDELRAGVEKANVQAVNLEVIMQGVDADSSGVIDYTEFLAAAMDKKQYLQRNVCYAAFCVFDQDSSGYISLEELKKILNSGDVEDVLDGRTAEDVLTEVDTDGDGQIDFEEFMVMMQGFPNLKGEQSPTTPLRERHCSEGDFGNLPG